MTYVQRRFCIFSKFQLNFMMCSCTGILKHENYSSTTERVSFGDSTIFWYSHIANRYTCLLQLNVYFYQLCTCIRNYLVVFYGYHSREAIHTMGTSPWYYCASFDCVDGYWNSFLFHLLFKGIHKDSLYICEIFYIKKRYLFRKTLKP